MNAFTLFGTAIGSCGMAWGAHGIVGVYLPAADDAALRAILRRRLPAGYLATPPADLARTIDRLVRLLDGEWVELEDVPLDMSAVPPFAARVYAAARAIPIGETLSYGEVATRMGAPGSARAVGQALGRNPFPLIVPCHRVLAAGGRMGGFSAPGGVTTKERLLAIERTARAGRRAISAPAHPPCVGE